MRLEGKYLQFRDEALNIVSEDRVYTDALRCLAWGTDASFYRLIPKIVVRTLDESEVSRLLALASRLDVPVTFRAAGTSLSGQTVTDSVMIVAGKHWEKYRVNDNGATVTMQPGIVGARVNEILKPYEREFTPDPASKNSAMVGGIVVNNASGMGCGTHANSDRVLRSVRLVLADGTVLDTGDVVSRREFEKTHPEFIKAIKRLRDDVRADSALVDRINYKYSIKNVTGLNLRPLVAFDDPFEIIAHSIVGSEGTLAFMSEVTVSTGPLYPFKATAMLYFDDLRTACEAIVALKDTPVHSAEILDSKSLESVKDSTGEGLTAILTETVADTEGQLNENISKITEVLGAFRLFKPVEFTQDPAVYGEYWKIRSGVFPSVGGTRPLGTTVLIEDVAFHLKDLPDATVALAQLLKDSGYDDACIYGHALEGNYHFIISQSFDTPEEVARYRRLMEGVEQLVIGRFDGSLKAEHGTGRNMAPFVRKEWGDAAWEAMRRLKRIFDPRNILNPGVIFNDDPECFIKNIKPMPLCDSHVDRCIECGFCEVNCVSCGLTLSSRQRIVSRREIAWLRDNGSDPDRLQELEHGFKYYGDETCAGDGLCSTSCPLGINTGEMIHDIRAEKNHAGTIGYKVGHVAAQRLRYVKDALRPVLSVANVTAGIIGPRLVNATGRMLHHVGVPLWSSALPGAYYPTRLETGYSEWKVVYFPSCINQTMGVTREDGGNPEPLVKVVTRLCRKAGFEVIFPAGMNNLCCGMIWESKGMPAIADEKVKELERALYEASDSGKYPVICDQSPCLHRMREHIISVKLYELTEFVNDILADYLDFHPVDEPIAVHVTCSTRRMGLADCTVGLARRCSSRVLVPEEVGCCGFAGDKGFTHPELNRYALRKLRRQIVNFGARKGYSNSRTCEIGLTLNGGIHYKSLVYLVDRVTTPKKY